MTKPKPKQTSKPAKLLSSKGKRIVAAMVALVAVFGSLAFGQMLFTSVFNNLDLAQANAPASGYGCGDYGSNGYGEDCVASVDPGDILLLKAEGITFNPPKHLAKEFCGSQGAANTRCVDLTLNVKDDRIAVGATCDIRVRNYPTANDASTAIDESNAPYTATPLTNISATYTAENGCTVTLPKASQTVPRWEFDILITNPANAATRPGMKFGSREAYFMNFGAIGVVSIGGVAL